MLTVRETMTLEMERRRWKYDGAKAAAIRQTFDETPTHYYQRLNALLDRPETLAHDAQLVYRLRRLPDRRRAARRGAARGAVSRPVRP
ncbi:MAG TPA: DUF3263 domain-containing protein [Marmoricola sp.]